MQQPRRLWRKIGLQKNFLEGTSHSDESKNTQFQESFIKSQLSQQQDLQNSSFLRMKNQQNKGEIVTDQVQKKRGQRSEIIESQSNCQTPIQILMTDSAIQSKYHLWENQDNQIISSLNKNLMMNGHVRYNSMGSYINIDESHFSDVIQTYGSRKEEDTVGNINNEINQQNKEEKQRVSKGDESKEDLSEKRERREITYQSYPLSLTGNKQQQIIKIRLMQLNNCQISKDYQKQRNINNDLNYEKQRKQKDGSNNQMEYEVRTDQINLMELQLMNKQERVVKIQQQLNTIKQFIFTNLSFEYKQLKQNHNIFKHQIINSLNHISLFIKTMIEQQFQQHISQLNDQIAYLYTENEELMLKIQHTQQSTKRVIDQNIMLNNKLQEYERNKQIQIKQYKQTITNLQNDINSLQQKLEDMQDLEDYQKHKSTLINQIKTYQGQKIKYQAQINRCEGQIKRYEGQIKRLQTEISRYQAQITQSKVSQSSLTDKVKQLSVELTTKQLKIQQLQWEITQSKNIQQQIQQIKTYQQQIKQLQIKIYQLNQQHQLNINKLNEKIQQHKNQYQKLTSQHKKLTSQHQKLTNQHQKQLSNFQKQRINLNDLRRQLSKMKEQTKEIVEMGQLLQTLLSESLRHNSLAVIANIQKEYNLKQYDTLFTMFAFIKQEIHHNNNKNKNNNNNNNNNFSNNNNNNTFQNNILQVQKHPQISPDDSIMNQQQKNTLISQPRTLNNESSTNLLRKTGYFGEPQSHQFPLNLTLHDIQKNYSTQIPEQSQPQHYQQENDNKRVKIQQMRQFQNKRGIKYFVEQMNTNKNVNNFDSDGVSFIDLKRQQSLKGMQNVNKRMINPSDKNQTFLIKDKNRGNSKERVKGTKINCNSFGIESVQYLGSSDMNMTGYQPQISRQTQFQLTKNQWRPTHGRNQSVGNDGLNKSGLKHNNEQKSNRYNNMNSQIQEDLQIVKSAFQSQNDDQVEDIVSHESSYMSRSKHNRNNLQQRKNNFNGKQKHQQFSIVAGPNYSFSEYNSNNHTNNLRHQRNIFGDESFLNQDDQFDANQQDDGFDSQSVMMTYRSKGYQINRDFKNNRDFNNNNNNSNSNNINIDTYPNNKYPTISNKYHTQTDKRYTNNNNNEHNNTSLTNSRLQIHIQKQTLPNKNNNLTHTHYGLPTTQSHKSQREDIIEKIKQRVKNKFRTSQSKHQPTYQTQQTPLTPSQPSYHVTPLSKSTYKKDYLHQNITKPSSLISDRKEQNIPSSNNNNNILAQFYQRHRNVTTNPAYNSLTLNQRSNHVTLNQRSNPLGLTQRNKSPSFHSASRSPSNTRSRSPSNSSSVTSRLTNKYQPGVGYTGGLSTNKNVPVGSTTPRSAFSRSLIEKPQLGGYSRKAENNLGPTYQPKGTVHTITSRESNTGSYVRKY